METQYSKENAQINIRFALASEAALAVKFMHKLGEFQKMRDSITVTESEMHDLLENQEAEAIFLEYNGEIKGFAFFCKHASAFIGKRVLYIDAFYIDENIRGKGAGKAMMRFLAGISLEKKCHRMEWACLDWNQPAWDFYVAHGVQIMDTLTLHRLDRGKLLELTKK